MKLTLILAIILFSILISGTSMSASMCRMESTDDALLVGYYASSILNMYNQLLEGGNFLAAENLLYNTIESGHATTFDNDEAVYVVADSENGYAIQVKRPNDTVSRWTFSDAVVCSNSYDVALTKTKDQEYSRGPVSSGNSDIAKSSQNADTSGVLRLSDMNKIQLYENAQNGFKMFYPMNWISREPAANDEGIVVGFLAPGEDVNNPTTYLLVQIEKLPVGLTITLEQYSQAVQRNLIAVEPDLKILTESDISIGEQPGYAIVYDLDSLDGNFRVYKAWTLHGENAYGFTYNAPYGRYDEFRGDINRMIGSLKFDMATGYPEASATTTTGLSGKNTPFVYGISEIVFPDPNLDAAIRAELNKPNGTIFVDDVGRLKSLDASERDIIDIAGLEYCTNLETLDLSNNKIIDVSPLSELTKLKKLDLRINQINDVSPLSGLTHLTDLNLFKNQITDISPLSRLVNLETLELSDNQIDNISSLSELTNLVELYLFKNEIDDISPLSGLINLEVLDLSDNEITDVSPLSQLANLAELYIGYNPITDDSPLSELPNLLIFDY